MTGARGRLAIHSTGRKAREQGRGRSPRYFGPQCLDQSLAQGVVGLTGMKDALLPKSDRRPAEKLLLILSSSDTPRILGSTLLRSQKAGGTRSITGALPRQAPTGDGAAALKQKL